MLLSSSNIFITRQLRKKFIYNNSSTFFNRISFGFFAFNNNLTTKEIVSLANYLSLFGFFVKKVPSSVFKSAFTGTNVSGLKGNILLLYTDNSQKLCTFPVISFYSLNKFRLPIFSVMFGNNLMPLTFFYKEIISKLNNSQGLFNNFFVSKMMFPVKIFRLLQVLFYKRLFIQKKN
jgi:hypothetical protein